MTNGIVKMAGAAPFSFFSDIQWDDIFKASNETLYMLAFSLLFTVVLGLLLGIVLFLFSEGQLLQNRALYGLLSVIVNVLRSVPFVILMILIMPFTKMIVGTSIGVKGAIPPLVVAAAPFFARLVETSLREVDKGVVRYACLLYGNVRRHRRRRIRRSGASLRLSALPSGCHDRNGRPAAYSGSNLANGRRYAGQGVQPKVTAPTTLERNR